MVKIPYGTSHFGSLIGQGYSYIDRTPFIEQLEQMGEQYIAFLRPRRFGKSLWISTLQHYYGYEHRQRFEALFGACYIGQHPTPLANAYLVLKLDFSGILTDSLESTYKGFLENVRLAVGDFIDTYRDFFSDEDPSYVLEPTYPSSILAELLSLVKIQQKKWKVYVLIDEDDFFSNRLLGFKPNDETLRRESFIRSFYEALKTGTADGVVDRIFITGVSPITLDSFTSGFNISRNLTTDLGLHQLMGFSTAEVQSLMQQIGVPPSGLPQLMNDLREWYNGYLFNKEATERLYNPDMVLYFALEYQKSRRYPDKLLDTNVASDYGKLHRMFRIGQQDEQHYEVIEELIQERAVAANLTLQFSFERSFTREDFISLLFYMGMLTIGEAQLNRLTFEFPNYVIEALYQQYFADILLQRAQLKRAEVGLDDAVERMALHNDLRPFVGIIERILSTLSNRDSMGFDEKHLKAIITSLLFSTGIYTIKSEYESGKQYVDLLLKRRPPISPNYTFALELKYLKKAEMARLEAVTAAGEAQLRQYLQQEELRQMPDLRAWLIVFVGTEAKVLKEINR